jgi:hypothetical protein
MLRNLMDKAMIFIFITPKGDNIGNLSSAVIILFGQNIFRMRKTNNQNKQAHFYMHCIHTASI